MRTDWLEHWANILVRYSLDVQPGQSIKLRGTTAAAPLIEAVFVALLRAGAHPRVNASLPGLVDLFYAHASNEQLSFLSPIDEYEARTVDASIHIKSEINTHSLSAVDPAKQVLTAKTAKPLSDLLLAKDRWVITLFPTPAYAQDADMSVADFEQFVADALFLDHADPLQAWQTQRARQEQLTRRLADAETIRIIAPDTDLTLSVAGRGAVNGDGKHNMPCGEVFTAPVETSAEGHIRFSVPVSAYGHEITDVYLEFSSGSVVKSSAGKNQAFLDKMLAIDDGARLLGEFGIGTNYGISRFTRNILFDEKAGGSIHLALGKSVQHCGGTNNSALHWDLITDMRAGGELYFDGTMVQKEGVFVDPGLPTLS